MFPTVGVVPAGDDLIRCRLPDSAGAGSLECHRSGGAAMSSICARCGVHSPNGAKFCLECGSPLAVVCPRCGRVAGGGKFCVECGVPLVISPTPSGALAAQTGPAVAGSSGTPSTASSPATGNLVPERRSTCVLSGDLVGLAGDGNADRDPEAVRELLSRYFDTARLLVARYGGTVEKFIGDAVMAVWGVPTAHEDDAERAVRAGLDLVAAASALGEEIGEPALAMRVGVVTGEVAVTLGAVGQGMVAGDAVNTASRVQAV